MVDEEILISVIIPVYNVELYLERCLNSICNNTYNNIQIICINDGSTDDSMSILHDFAQKDNRVEIIEKLNAGVSAARNDGIKAARGDYIAFIDADDWIHSRYFEALIQPVQKHEADISVCKAKRVFAYCRDDGIDGFNTNYLSGEDILSDATVKGSVWAKLYKKSKLIGIKFEEKVKFLEDELFNLSVICSHTKISIYYIDLPLYYYFQRNESAVHSLNHGEEIYWAIRGYISYIKKGQLSDCSKLIFIEQALKSTFAYRYLMMFEEDQEIDIDCKCFFDFLWKELKGKLNLEKWLLYKSFITMPSVYRLYRIFTDKTMLDWERAQKVNLNRKKTEKWKITK